MNDYLKKVISQISDFLKGLSPMKKMAMGLTAAGIVVALTALFFWAGDTTYMPLMTNLNPDDASNIIRVLRDKRIPFKVDPSGRNISIPPENLYNLRLELATMGLPQSGVVGYEVFDKESLGTTSFVQQVNQKRAQEGELMRTINTIKGVRRSRVHLAIPQKSAFIEDQKKPTASVVLDLEPGTVLTDRQVYGIGNLVARAVEGLDVSDVVIVDSNGKVLSKNPSDPLAAETATQIDFQEKVEDDYEKRIESMLSRIVGDGRVVARVSADMDFSQVTESQTLFDPDGTAIRSVNKNVDSMNGTRPGPYGVAGAASNLPGQPPAANGQVKTNTNKDAETINYEVPQTIRRTTRPAGTIRRLSVAVLVDGKPTQIVAKNGQTQTKVEAWPAEKLKEMEDIVAGAVGLDRKRGDTIDIKNMEFTREDFAEAQRVIAEREKKSYIQNMLVYGVIGATILLFFLFVVRPFIKWITENTIDSVDTFLPQTIEELEHMQKSTILPNLEEAVPVLPDTLDPQKVEGEMIKEKIITLVDANPHKAALILKDWLHLERRKSTETTKKDDDNGKGKSASA